MEWLVKIRLEKGYTQEALALIIRCSQSALANIETGKRMPSVKLAKKIAVILGFHWSMFYEQGEY